MGHRPPPVARLGLAGSGDVGLWREPGRPRMMRPPSSRRPASPSPACRRRCRGRGRASSRSRFATARPGRPAFCRLNVVGPDGNFYQPPASPLSPYSLTGQWPKTGKGNREGKAPIRYLGRFFYSSGQVAVDVPGRQGRGSRSGRGSSIDRWPKASLWPPAKPNRCSWRSSAPRRWPRSATTRATRTCTFPAGPRPTTR